jgi:hypothetical protein
MVISSKTRGRPRIHGHRFTNRVWVRLEELEPRSLLAVTVLTPAQALPFPNAAGSGAQQSAQALQANSQPSSSGNIVANQATSNANSRVLSVDYALVALPLDGGALEFQTPARSTGEYFLSNQGLLPLTPAALQTVSRLPSLSQGITRPAFGGGGTEINLTANQHDNTLSLDPFNQNIAPSREEPTPKPNQGSTTPQLPAVPPQGLPLPPRIEGSSPQTGAPPDKSWAQVSASIFAAEVDGESLHEEPATLRAPDLVQAAAAAAGALATMTWHREQAGQRRWRIRIGAAR